MLFNTPREREYDAQREAERLLSLVMPPSMFKVSEEPAKSRKRRKGEAREESALIMEKGTKYIKMPVDACALNGNKPASYT